MFKNIDYMMVMVSDMQASIMFYRDKLGLTLKFESPDWTEFNTGTSTLALHGGGAKPKAPPSEEKQAGVCTLGFNVPNLDQSFEELKAKGVRFVMPPKTQDQEKIKLAVAIDPDGLAISFVELLK